MTIEDMSRLCCSVGTVTVAMEGGNTAKTSVLVVHGKPLGYDLLLGIDAIRALGGVAVWPSGQMRIGGGLVPTCAAITINKPVFTFTFDQQSRAWMRHGSGLKTATLKNWTMDYRSIQWQQRSERITSGSFACG